VILVLIMICVLEAVVIGFENATSKLASSFPQSTRRIQPHPRAKFFVLIEAFNFIYDVHARPKFRKLSHPKIAMHFEQSLSDLAELKYIVDHLKRVLVLDARYKYACTKGIRPQQCTTMYNNVHYTLHIAHTEHCLDYSCQSIMCAAATSLKLRTPMVWYARSDCTSMSGLLATLKLLL
jgi:hypothetical protein